MTNILHQMECTYISYQASYLCKVTRIRGPKSTEAGGFRRRGSCDAFPRARRGGVSALSSGIRGAAVRWEFRGSASARPRPPARARRIKHRTSPAPRESGSAWYYGNEGCASCISLSLSPLSSPGFTDTSQSSLPSSTIGFRSLVSIKFTVEYSRLVPVTVRIIISSFTSFQNSRFPISENDESRVGTIHDS